MITLTSKAVDQVKGILTNEKDKELVLRIGVQGGGCSGLSYKLGFSKKDDQDKIFHFDDLEVVVDSKSHLYLDGVTIDFQDGLNGKGFSFSNPNVSRTCGCGSSFSA